MPRGPGAYRRLDRPVPMTAHWPEAPSPWDRGVTVPVLLMSARSAASAHHSPRLARPCRKPARRRLDAERLQQSGRWRSPDRPLATPAGPGPVAPRSGLFRFSLGSGKTSGGANTPPGGQTGTMSLFSSRPIRLARSIIRLPCVREGSFKRRESRRMLPGFMQTTPQFVMSSVWEEGSSALPCRRVHRPPRSGQPANVAPTI